MDRFGNETGGHADGVRILRPARAAGAALARGMNDLFESKGNPKEL